MFICDVFVRKWKEAVRGFMLWPSFSAYSGGTVIDSRRVAIKQQQQIKNVRKINQDTNASGAIQLFIYLFIYLFCERCDPIIISEVMETQGGQNRF